MVFSSPLGLGVRQFLRHRRYRPTPRRRRRNKRVQAVRNADPVTSNTISVVDGDSVDLVMMEILSRLPVKSLLRFKCVCKRWRYLIEQDPYFINLHLTQSIARPNLFIVVPTETKKATHRGGTSCKDVFLAANLFSEGRDRATAAVHTVTEIDSPYYSKILGPLNGLVGFFDSKIDYGVRICNVGTLEITPWIKSTLLSSLQKDGFPANPICRLGFDPVTKEHKFICTWDICPAGNLPTYQVFEVLTVGDTAWRRNDKIPPFKLSHFEDPTSYTNGSVYYKTSVLYSSVHDDDRPEYIVAFDVGSEMFRALKIPKFILYRPWDTYFWGEDRRLYFSSVLGTNQIILISYRRARSDDKTYEDEVSVHSCNWKKTTTFTKLKITGIPSSILNWFPFTIFTTYFESLLPVQKHIATYQSLGIE